MRAFAIFAGGGVKGAAFAGCLRAAEERGIDFVGYGGTSAGAIAALLAAVGYSAEELSEILVKRPFSDLLDGSMEDIKTLRRLPKQLEKGIFRTGISLWWNHVSLTDLLAARLGVDSGKVLRSFLDTKIREKLPQLSEVQNISFRHLAEEGCTDFKVLTSDLLDRKPLVYSVDSHPEAYVVDAVRASISYPLVFEPVTIKDRRLADGGLSCNLPLSLFYRETRKTNIPVLAFDLVAAAEEPPAEYTLSHFLADMAATALESSESLLWEVVDGVYHVVVPVPAGIKTMDFDLSLEQRQSLYQAGYEATNERLAKLPQWFDAKNSIEEIRAQYASDAVVHRLLAAIAHDIEGRTPPKDLRLNVMFPVGGEKLKIVYYYRMEGDADLNIDLLIDGGCAGTAFTNAKPITADLAAPQADVTLVAEWKMTPEQQALVRNDRRAVISVPLFDTSALVNDTQEQREVRAVLNIDTSTRLEDTLWAVQDDPGYRAIMEWSDVLSSVLFAK